jgi:hypothetical protein
MNQNLLTRLVIVAVVLFVGCKSAQREKNTSSWQPLLNQKDLSGWDTYIGPAFDTVTGKQVGEPLGLNVDPLKVFSIVKEDGQPALRISGERFGGVSTQQQFTNYQLKLEFKWGKLKWAPRKNAKRDSGILYHAVGAHGADWGYWMRSQEFQVQEGDCGDYWGVARAAFDIPAVQVKAGEFRYDPSGKLQDFREGSASGRHCIKYPDAEKPSGEWNLLEVYCFGGTSVHIVNGKTVMVLYNSREPDANGNDVPLAKGKIQLQSEGAEVFYRNIMVKNIEGIPAEVIPSR